MKKQPSGFTLEPGETAKLIISEDLNKYKFEKESKDHTKPLYEHNGNEVWDAKDYLRPVVMTSSQRFWLLMGTVVVAAIGFRILLFLISIL